MSSIDSLAFFPGLPKAASPAVVRQIRDKLEALIHVLQAKKKR